MKNIEFKVVKRNKYGHRWIIEPKERIDYRKKCKYYGKFGMCDKGCLCYDCSNPRSRVLDSVLLGCTANAYCRRLDTWDRRHGLIKPYTIVAQKQC